MNYKNSSSKYLIDILRLINTPNIGPITFIKLVEQYGSPTKALEALPTLSSRFKKPLKIYSKQKAELDIETANKNNISIISYLDDNYPPMLKLTEDYPPLLFVKGNDVLLRKTSVAIVGSRNSSINGKKIAFSFAKELGEHGYVVTSGLAKGIDCAAHEGSLQKGTIAFLGGGVDVVYPKENQKLYEKICDMGAVVSEFPIGTSPIPSNFPKRNRLIAGISRGVLVIEAKLNSGSLITSKIAIENNREVFSVPGSPSDLKSSGCNALIKDGAILTENINDIIGVLKAHNNINIIKENIKLFDSNKTLNLDNNILENARKIITEALSSTPISVDILLQETKIHESYVNTVLLELELMGKLERLPNNKVALIG